ncbi:hypothetical protein [Streptomyces sp. NPDC008141]|uniref:hypothetical protein n=1 Tax=Streptomyces sp. NPDC008141 TaxID=3364815 RepID=UPI0036EFF2C4
MMYNHHSDQKNTKRAPGPTRRLRTLLAAALTGLAILTGPSQAVATEPARTLLSHTQPAPAPAPAPAPDSAVPAPAPPPPQTDTQPPGVSAYLPPEAIIAILTMITLLILGLRHGAAIGRCCINALVRLFQPPGI